MTYVLRHDDSVLMINFFLQYVQDDDDFTLKSVNEIYVDKNYSLRSEFQTTLKNHFGASTSAQNLDFVSTSKDCRVAINKQVEELTCSKIKDLIPQGML